MRIGVPQEIKDQENRVALTPAGVAGLVGSGHRVSVQKGAGKFVFSDAEYEQAGAVMVTAREAWDSDLVVKIKEPQPSEYEFLNGQILFTYLHLAGTPPHLTEALLSSKTTGIAYETVEDDSGKLPLLAPMSAVAGMMSVTVGANYLARPSGGRGMLLGNVQGESFGKVVIVGDGVVGRHAARAADGLGAKVVVFGPSAERESVLKDEVSQRVDYRVSTPENLTAELREADLLVGAVYLRGNRAPHLVSEDMVKGMPAGSVIVDVSIDQGGCVETSRPTSHSEPIFEQHGVTHYCVTNMPGAYPRTSVMALTSATLPYVERIAKKGLLALSDDPGLARGLNTHDGFITYRAAAEALGMTGRYRALGK